MRAIVSQTLRPSTHPSFPAGHPAYPPRPRLVSEQRSLALPADSRFASATLAKLFVEVLPGLLAFVAVECSGGLVPEARQSSACGILGQVDEIA